MVDRWILIQIAKGMYMSRSRKRKLLSKCFRSTLNGGRKPPTGAGRAEAEAYKITTNRLLCASVAGLLGTPSVAQTVAGNADSSLALDEIIVTASKRAQSIQDVPVSILALDSTMLDEHQVASLDDYTKLLPGVSIDSFGPGQADISFRGITTRTGTPTSGLYIDDIPIASSGSNPAGGVSAPDLHLYDINRVEALSGPQGTLYGASSLAGTLKIVTNQPDTTKFSAGYDLQGDKFGPGGYGGILESFVNLPLSDIVALRLVGFTSATAATSTIRWLTGPIFGRTRCRTDPSSMRHSPSTMPRTPRTPSTTPRSSADVRRSRSTLQATGPSRPR